MASPEHQFQTSVGKLSKECIIEPFRFRAFDRSKNESGTQHLAEANRCIRAGTPDTETIYSGRSCCIELKKWGTQRLKKYQPSDNQIREMGYIRDAGAYAECAWTHFDVVMHWRAAGVKLSPLADEYAAARDRKFALLMSPDADGVVKKPRGVGRRMVEKPQAATLRKMAAMRARTMC